MSVCPLELRRVAPEQERGLARFFAAMVAQGDDRWFHPHPFTAEHASYLAGYQGHDLYYVATKGDEVLAYGMLRGWDEGYSVPSLGIAVLASARGTGLARTFMQFLHTAARYHGATRVRLKVYPENVAARRLYESLGYRFEAGTDHQLLGVYDFVKPAA
jgi:ribosomal protein S18 acetylase RimI-like enzyme